MMYIATGLIDEYLNYVTSYVGDIGGVPEDLTEYYTSIINMKLAANERRDLDCLKLLIDYLLTTNKSDYETIHYIYSAEEFKELLTYIRNVIWPDSKSLPVEILKDIKLMPMSSTDWWKIHETQDPLNAHDND
jgi:hypothetical protein